MSAPLTHIIVWEGIEIEVTHTPLYCAEPPFDHIELRVKGKLRLPMTETGYRSHFLPAREVMSYGDAAGYVRAWLDHEAQSASWRVYVESSRQLSLF
ncbi:hypothetical protein [Novosphingobium aquimarinum]|uniref:hypothetical protein n=1 Tax=Novosphingobium aquimarinum TaxID=2682494 RepID=UPI0012EC8BFE|nr:hypothetical protein [Novosphingobium aquimarinum]